MGQNALGPLGPWIPLDDAFYFVMHFPLLVVSNGGSKI
jgi:hypothetical protein